jgi:hypothetical protein
VSADLERLARLHGVELAYRDVDDAVQHADPDVLLAVLRALGGGVDGSGDVPDALAAYERERWTRRVEPVTAAFDGRTVPVQVRLGAEAVRELARVGTKHLTEVSGLVASQRNPGILWMSGLGTSTWIGTIQNRSGEPIQQRL